MIIIDDREVKSGICDELANLNVPFCVERLKIGDYIINNTVFIERKTTLDFTESLKDRRLFDQVARLRANNKRSILIIEGARLQGNKSVRGESKHNYEFRTKKGVASMQERMLMQMRQIGPDLARKLIRKFETIDKIINASDEELLEINGIGKQLVHQIRILK